MGKALLFVALVAAAFAGGAAVNGPGLKWARGLILDGAGREDSIPNLDDALRRSHARAGGEDDGPRVGREAKQEQGQGAPEPSDPAKEAGPEPVAAKAPRGPTVEPESRPLGPPEGRESEAPPDSDEKSAGPEVPAPPSPIAARPADDTDASHPEEAIGPAEERAGDDPGRKVEAVPPPLTAPTPTPAGPRDSRPRLDPAVTPANLPPMPPAPLSPGAGGEAEGAGPEGDRRWADLRRRMKDLGVTRYWIEGDGDGPARFRCVVPLAGRRAVGQQFEAEADDPPAAAEAALKRVALWKATEAP